MGKHISPLHILAKQEYTIEVERFSAKFVYLGCLGMSIPLIVYVSEEKTSKSLYDDDIEFFWSRNKFPNSNDFEGNHKGFGKFEICPIGESLFSGKFIHLGFFSKSGVSFKIGCSFKLDYFETFRQIDVHTLRELKKDNEKNQEKDDDKVVEKIMGVDLKSADFEHTLRKSLKIFNSVPRLALAFMNNIRAIKEKKLMEQVERSSTTRNNVRMVKDRN